MISPKILALGIATALALPGFSQIIPDNTTNTVVSATTIGGGTVSGTNLFHSFSYLNVPETGLELTPGNISGTKINNIFIRVTGTSPTYIQGKINTKSAFPNANLYLINARGIVFQPQGQLAVGGSFWGLTTTTLQFQEQSRLEVFPSASAVFPADEVTNLEFALDRPAPIFNQGELVVNPGKNLVLVGGAVFSDGALRAPNGNVVVSAPIGGSRVEVRRRETSLGLTTITGVLEPSKMGVLETENPDVLRPALPESAPEAKTIVARSDGKITLVPENLGLVDQVLPDGRVSTTGGFTLLPGDVALKTIEAGNLQVEAPSDIVLLVPQISATGGISLNAGSTITFRDSLEFASNLRANSNLVLRGDGRIDFLAVNFPESTIRAEGNLVFISRRDIWADSLFAVGGRVVVESSPSEEVDLFAANQNLPKLLQPSPRLVR
ncbi:MAG: filamentous hemagglutinin N-terminal domain-containing protein [Cyanobacteria bacterium KgW148]|nr:filamentous hemagglutinin N-terminal domain-containing protein [Cyanobacteria bacterium KgW148]